MKIKTKSNLLIAILALATTMGFLGFIVGTGSAKSEPTIIEVYPTDWNLYQGQTYLWYSSDINNWILVGGVKPEKTTNPVIINGEPNYPEIPELLPDEYFYLPDEYFYTNYWFTMPGNTYGLITYSCKEMVDRGVSLTQVQAYFGPTGWIPTDQLLSWDIELYENYMEKEQRRQQIMDEHMEIVRTYYSLDDNNIQSAIDAASPGDTIILKSGKFYLAKYGPEDVEIQTAQGSFKYAEENWGTSRGAIFPTNLKGLRWGIWDNRIDINKPYITIMGEKDVDGSNPTVITHTNHLQMGGVDQVLGGDEQVFILNAPYITISNIRFELMLQTIHAYHAGFVIENCRFVDSGFAPYLCPDAYSTFPNYPDFKKPIRSYFQNNKLIRCAQAPHLVGSWVTVSNNVFQCSTGTRGLVVISWGALTRGQNSRGTPAIPINWDHINYNTIENNIIDMFGKGSALYITNTLGGEARDNIVRGNTIRNCDGDGIWIYGMSPFADVSGSSGHLISDNVIERCGWPIGLWSARGDNVEEVFIRGNQLIDCFNPDEFGVAYPGVYIGGMYTRNNVIIHNDYSQSGYPGIINGEVPCIFLYPYTSDNIIIESNSPVGMTFPLGTSLCDQIDDRGTNNLIPGYAACEHNPQWDQIVQSLAEKLSQKMDQIENYH